MAKTPLEIASLARMHTKKAVKTLAAIMNEPRAPYAARVAAAEALLDRGWGKPRQSHEAEITHRSAKLEYDFVQLDDLTFGPGPFLGNTFTASREIQMFKVGLNYRFGSLFGGGYGGSY
jgi:hypothetical protein